MTRMKHKGQGGGGERASIRRALLVYLAVFCAVVLLVIWLTQAFFLGFIYRQVALLRMDQAAGELVAAISAPASPWEENSEAAREIAVRYQVSVLLFLREGDRLGPRCLQMGGDAGEWLFGLSLDELSGLCERAAAAGGRTSTTYQGRYVAPRPGHPERQSGRLIYVALLTAPDGEEVAVFLDCPMEPVGVATGVITVEMMLLSLFLVVAVLVLTYWISRRIARPIAAINRGAKSLAAGHYDVTFSGGGLREVEELSATLNYAAEELSKIDRLQKELIANISHDLRTPLTMIIGYAEIMRDIEGENTPENVGVIIDEAKRLSELVNDLLCLSRCQSGAEKLALDEFDLGELVDEAVDRYRRMLAARGFRFDGCVERGLAVRADRQKIQQVIANLVNNAVNYSGESRDIRISCYRTAEGAAHFEVIDHGEGIPKEHLADIWQRYYKVDARHKRSVIGSGLGLSIVRGVLELHGARYGVDSCVGEGSRFWFDLPLADR